MRTSTITLAAASAPGTAWRRSNAAPTTSPPTCATGKRTLTASRTNLNPRQVPSCGRTLAGKSSHQPAPATQTVTARTTTTSRIPQPTLETASPTEPTPDQTVSATIAAMPANQAATPACLTTATPTPLPTTFSQRPLSAPRTQSLELPRDPAPSVLMQARYQGVLMSKACVAPNPIVSWSGEPRCVTSGEPAASPLSRSYSRKACVAPA